MQFFSIKMTFNDLYFSDFDRLLQKTDYLL